MSRWLCSNLDNVFSFSQNLYRLASEGNSTRMTQIERIYTDKIIKICPKGRLRTENLCDPSNPCAIRFSIHKIAKTLGYNPICNYTVCS